MKSFLSILCALMLLYIGRDTHTELLADNSVSKPLPNESSSRSKTASFDIKYQHVRFVGQEIEVLAHDLWETQTLRLRIPAHVQTGDIVSLDAQRFQYQNGQTYRMLEGILTVQKAQQTTEPYSIEVVLDYCVTDEKTVFCVSKMLIRVVY